MLEADRKRALPWTNAASGSRILHPSHCKRPRVQQPPEIVNNIPKVVILIPDSRSPTPDHDESDDDYCDSDDDDDESSAASSV